MDDIKKIDYNFIKSENSDKVIVAFHGWQGNKDTFYPLSNIIYLKTIIGF